MCRHYLVSYPVNMPYSIGGLRPPKWQTSASLLFFSFTSSWWYGKGKPSFDSVFEKSGWSCFSLNAEDNQRGYRELYLFVVLFLAQGSASQVNSHLYCNCCSYITYLPFFLSSLSPSFHFFLLLSVFPPSLPLSPFHSFLIHIWALWESTLELKRQWKYPLKHNMFDNHKKTTTNLL